MQTEHSVSILLVDDRLENLLALESILSDLGHHLVKAQSGTEALRALLKQEFAVILLDVQMPEMDGFETAALIRARERSQHTPIIFLTALDNSDTNVFKGYSVGAVDFMIKPFMPEVLRFKVTVFVELFKKTAQLERYAAELEEGIQKRTADLVVANESLRAEIVERERAEQALLFLTNATALLASSLDYEHTLEHIVHLAVPYLADMCVVNIAPDGLAPRRVVLAHRDRAVEPALLDQVSVGELPWAGDPPLMAALRYGKSTLVSGMAGAEALAGLTPPQQAALGLGFGFESALCVPLVMRGRTVGCMTLLHAAPGRYSNEHDLPLAQELSRRAALALENAGLYREVQQALHARDQFLSIASHELKTPITAVLGYAQLLERRIGRDPNVEPRNLQALQTLAEQCQRLDRLIRSLLDLSRIQTGQFTLDVVRFDVVRLLGRIAEETRPSLKNHALQVQTPDAELAIEGDELRIAQVIHNLIQNAVKYSPNGGEIELQVVREPDGVAISVRDEGVGIPASALPQLFNRFYRANNVDPQITGMGLGLYVVKEIVTLHGGEVQIKSAEGAGSTFTVRLPLTLDRSLPEALASETRLAVD